MHHNFDDSDSGYDVEENKSEADSDENFEEPGKKKSDKKPASRRSAATSAQVPRTAPRPWSKAENVSLLKTWRDNLDDRNVFHQQKADIHNKTFLHNGEEGVRTKEGCTQQMDKLVKRTPAGMVDRINAKIAELEAEIADEQGEEE